mgnify:CR=1 FL=1
MESARLARINELARKQKTVGLTEDERREQAVLRRGYIDDLKSSLRRQLDQIEFIDDGKKG